MLDNNDINDIVMDMIEELREMNDGDSTCTSSLFKEYGYDEQEYDRNFLITLHDRLFEVARENGITLDMSAHEGLDEGLPYNLDYVVHNKQAQIKCPHCGSTDTARYLYGYLLWDEKLRAKIDSGKIVIGGCVINTMEVDGEQVSVMPERKCNSCGKDFGEGTL